MAQVIVALQAEGFGAASSPMLGRVSTCLMPSIMTLDRRKESSPL